MKIDIDDIDMNKVTKDMFVCFYTGFIEEEGYGTKKYFTEHPQLSNELLEVLLKKNVSIIGVDFAGVRRGKEKNIHLWTSIVQIMGFLLLRIYVIFVAY